MASVFLSYDRDDGAKAKSIATALEKAGHSVWWDRHIKGGSRYAAEIEKALSEADAVVVLWSRQSVQSDWVRDEAGKGRDSGRLVPARIDDVEPPLGFGQHHTTDLSKWRGRAATAQFKALLDAVEGVGSGDRAMRTAVPPLPTITRRGRIILIAAVVAVFAIGLILWQPWNRGRAGSVVAIVAAGPSTETRSLARDLLAKLGILQSSKTDSFQLVDGKSARNSDFIFEVESVNNERSATAILVLLGGKDRSLLWSQEFEQPAAKQADLKQQMAYTAAKVLECAVDVLSSVGQRMGQETLKLYLNGCAGLAHSDTDNPEALLPVLRRVTEDARGFAGAWANLLRAEVTVFLHRDMQDRELRRRLLSNVVRARRVNPTLAETFLVESWLAPQRPISGWMPLVEKAVQFNPNHSGALQERAENYMFVGRTREAVTDAQRAVKFDPLSPSARKTLVLAYAFAGQLEAARAELREAERIWPGAMNLMSARHLIDLRYGDARAALALLTTGEIGAWNVDETRAFLEARIDRSPRKVERALEEARAHFAREPESLSNLSQSLAEFRRLDELIQILLTTDPDLIPFLPGVLFRPQFSALHRDRRFMVISERLGLLDYWRTSGKWPDFCAEPALPYDCKAEAAKLAA